MKFAGRRKDAWRPGWPGSIYFNHFGVIVVRCLVVFYHIGGWTRDVLAHAFVDWLVTLIGIGCLTLFVAFALTGLVACYSH